MAWLFQIENLIPPSISPVGQKTVSYRHPLTPFWWRPGTAGQKRQITLRGEDFHSQNVTAYPTDDDYPENPQAVCGSTTYRQASSTYTWSGASCTAYASGSQSITRYYDFTVSTAVQTLIEYDPPLNPGPPFVGLPGITSPIPRDATSSSLRGDVTYETSSCTLDAYDRLLSDEVDAAWLIDQTAVWSAQSDAVKNMSLSTGLSGAYSEQSEGQDGWFAVVSFLDVRPQGFWFSGTPSGMTGNLGDLWNGNFSAWLVMETRRNFPQVLPEGDGDPDPLATGIGIYKEGTDEMTLSDEVTNFYVDQYGVFTLGEDGTDWDAALADAPYRPAYLGGVPWSEDFSSFSMGYSGSNAGCNELMLFSATGKRYRVTIEFGNVSYPEDPEELPVWAAEVTYVMTTDETTGQATQRFGPETEWLQGRVGLVEQWDGSAWVILADVSQWEANFAIEQEWNLAYNAYLEAYYEWVIAGEEGPEPVEPPYPELGAARLPSDLISHSPLVGRPHLVSVAKKRLGAAFGFYAYDGSGRRFATEHVSVDRSTGTVDVSSPRGCSANALDGSLIFESVQQWIDGELQPVEVTAFSATCNEVDWTPQEWENLGFTTGLTTISATLRRRTRPGPEVAKWTEDFTVLFNSPSSNGKLLSTSHELRPMSIVSGTNRTPWIEVDVPAPGTSCQVAGFRLTS